MKNEVMLRNSIRLRAGIQSVWTALTDPAMTRHYMYGCEALSDWKVGSSLVWKGAMDGKVYVKGNIVEIQRDKLLSYTVIDPNSGIEDIPSNYLTVTLELSEEGRDTILSVTTGDFSVVADGETRYKHSLGGWEYVLKGLKDLVEKPH